MIITPPPPRRQHRQTCWCRCCRHLRRAAQIYQPPLPVWRPCLAPAMHGCRVQSHHLTQHCHHRKWHHCCHLRQLVQICQLPFCLGWPCLSGHCPTSSLLLPLLRWRTWLCHDCVAASIALVSFPSSCWYPCLSHSGFCPIRMLLATHCRCRAGVLASFALAPFWHCAGVIALVAQASPQASRWHLCPPRAGTNALVVLASSP
jgi:hypothetical protein